MDLSLNMSKNTIKKWQYAISFFLLINKFDKLPGQLIINDLVKLIWIIKKNLKIYMKR